MVLREHCQNCGVAMDRGDSVGRIISDPYLFFRLTELKSGGRI